MTQLKIKEMTQIVKCKLTRTSTVKQLSFLDSGAHYLRIQLETA